MALSLAGLRCVVAVVDSGFRVSAAAERLHLSQPAVSRQLAQVEEALGLMIFQRRGRQFEGLIPEGEEVLGLARRMLEDCARLRALARAGARPESVFAIAAPQSCALYVLPPLLRELSKRFPELDLRLRTTGEGDPPRPAEHASCDLVLFSTAFDEPADAGAVPLFRWRRVVVVERSHPLAAHQGVVGVGDLVRWPLVTYEAAGQPGASFLQHVCEGGQAVRFAVLAADPLTVKAHVRAGLGVGVVAEMAVEPADREDLVVLELDPRFPECIAWAMLPPGHPPRAPALALLRALAPWLGEAERARLQRGETLAADPGDVPRFVRAGSGPLRALRAIRR